MTDSIYEAKNDTFERSQSMMAAKLVVASYCSYVTDTTS